MLLCFFSTQVLSTPEQQVTNGRIEAIHRAEAVRRKMFPRERTEFFPVALSEFLCELMANRATRMIYRQKPLC
jgi:hypothetical protein